MLRGASGETVFKKGSIPRAVAMPLLFSHSSRLSIFRASRWGAPALPSSSYRWRSATSWGLALFSHRSASRIFIMQPGCSSPPVVTQNDDHQPCGGEERAGLWPPPCPQLQGCSSSMLGARASRVGALPSAWAGDPLLPPAFGGEGRSPALRRRRTATCCLVGVWLSVHRTGDGRAVRRSPTSTARPAPLATPRGRTRRRTPRGRCPRPWMVLSLLP
jgi:hypothetical protein